MAWLYRWSNGFAVSDVPMLNWLVDGGSWLVRSPCVKKHHQEIVWFGKGTMITTLCVILKLFINIKKII